MIENDKKFIYTFLKVLCDSINKDEKDQIVNIEDLKKFCTDKIFHDRTN